MEDLESRIKNVESVILTLIDYIDELKTFHSHFRQAVFIEDKTKPGKEFDYSNLIKTDLVKSE